MLLDIRDLDVHFATPDGDVHAVRGAGLSVARGECLGVVGESGSGKSQLFLAAAGLLASNGRATGSVTWHGREILNAPPRVLNTIRGSGLTMVFQDPLTSLTPHMTIGEQVAETLRVHRGLSRTDANARALAMLEQVRIPNAVSRMRAYPHQLSGGMRQRVMLAMAAVCGPELLVADEPTTALDVTVQAQILSILRELRDRTGMAIVLISHDMGVIAGLADRVQVMKDGAIVETGPVRDIFHAPKHPYTRTLLNAVPRLDAPRRTPPPVAAGAPVILSAENLSVRFDAGRGPFRRHDFTALDSVNVALRAGETLGVVGESGSGKSTFARAILRLLPKPSAREDGTVLFLGQNITAANARAMRHAREDLQIVFQDPLASLDPRMPVGQSIAEPLAALKPHLSRAERAARVREMMRAADLDPALMNRYPHELSGGQNQRAGIARAMIVEPKLVVCDEAVSALDVTVQAQIVDLIAALQARTGMALIFISHDLSVVRALSHRVMVLYRGRMVELAPAESLYRDPRHSYTRALLAAVPVPDPAAPRPTPLPYTPPATSALREIAPGHWVADGPMPDA